MTTHPSTRQLDALSIAQSIELRLRQIVNGEWSDSRTDGEYADMARTLRDINDRLYGVVYLKNVRARKTVRQEVVQFAAARRCYPPAGAINDVCDRWERDPVNSIKHQMGLYVRDLSDAAWKRLVRDVAKARRNG